VKFVFLQASLPHKLKKGVMKMKVSLCPICSSVINHKFLTHHFNIYRTKLIGGAKNEVIKVYVLNNNVLFTLNMSHAIHVFHTFCLYFNPPAKSKQKSPCNVKQRKRMVVFGNGSIGVGGL
jgi:hypothetical protein